MFDEIGLAGGTVYLSNLDDPAPNWVASLLPGLFVVLTDLESIPRIGNEFLML